ncbi:MAG: rhodanese-like domain-containing protein [Candidatus Helarchaeota archaeon]
MDTKVSSIFQKDAQIITYSEDHNCPASGIAAEKLVSMGYSNVLRYKDGWKAWKTANFPVERSS